MISGVSCWRGYSNDGEGERDDGGVCSNHSASMRGTGVSLILLTNKGAKFEAGEDMVVERIMIGVGWVVMCQMALGCLL